MGNFKDLKVWQSSTELAIKIYKLTNDGAFTRDMGLKDQMRRSSVSVSSNIAEGDDLGTDKQSIKYFYIARGSIAELRTQVFISREVGYITDIEFNEIDNQCRNISGMLMKLIKHRSVKETVSF
jgi:four helix bundle protein